MVYFPRRIVACACVDADTSDHRDIVIVSAFLIISIGTLKRERETQVLLKTTIKVAKPVPVTVTVDDCGWLWHVCCPCGILWSREVMALAQTRVQTKACAVTSFNIFQHLSTGRNMQWSDDIRWYQMISDVLRRVSLHLQLSHIRRWERPHISSLPSSQRKASCSIKRIHATFPCWL